MINAYVSPDAESETATPPKRRTLYVWLLAILAIFLGVALIINLVQNMPQVNQGYDNRIEGYRQRFKCDDGEVLVVEEFADGLYKVDCVVRG